MKNYINEDPQPVEASKYQNIDFRDRVVGSSTPSKDKINPSLLDDVDKAAGIAGVLASVTTAVSGHDGGTRHQSGLAVDIAMFDGKGYHGIEDAKNKGIYNKIEKFVKALEGMGYKINSERGNDKAVLWFGFSGHHHHVHVSRKSDPEESDDKKTITMTVAQIKKVPKMESETFFSGGKPIKIISTPSDHAKRSTSDWSSRHAWDIQAPIGTSVYSLTHGKVSKKHESSRKKKNIFGTQLSITGENGDPSIFYTHLDSVKLEPGDKVKPGDFIGKITKWPSYPNSSHVHVGTDQGKDIFEFMDKDGNIKNAPDVPSDEDAPEQVEFDVLKVDKEKIKKALEDFFSTGTKKIDDIEAELNKQNATMYPNKKISEEKNRILDIFSKIL